MMPRNDIKKYLSRTVLSVSISSVLSVSNQIFVYQDTLPVGGVPGLFKNVKICSVN